MPSHHSRGRGRTRGRHTAIGSWSRVEATQCLTWTSFRLSLSQETTEFISACEALHARLACNGPLTREEKDLIEFSVLDLLSKVKPKPASSY
jgi:hypothetical protein